MTSRAHTRRMRGHSSSRHRFVATILFTGECERIGGKVGGLAVHIGARVAGLAGGGEVFVTGTTQEMTAGSGIAFDPLGSKELRGVPGDWRVFSVPATDGRGPLPELEPPKPRKRPPPRRRRVVVGAAIAALISLAVAIPLALSRGAGTAVPPKEAPAASAL